MNTRQYFNNWRKNQRTELINKGLCSNNCGRKLVIKWFCRECADKVNEYARNHWNKNIEHNRIIKNNHTRKYRFGGLRDAVVQRDNNTCQICFRDKKVHVHHIDENPKNNTMDNLICLCYICHVVVERINRTKPDIRHLFPWYH